MRLSIKRLNPFPLSLGSRLWVEKHITSPFGFNLCAWCNIPIDVDNVKQYGLRCAKCQARWLEYMKDELDNEYD